VGPILVLDKWEKIIPPPPPGSESNHIFSVVQSEVTELSWNFKNIIYLTFNRPLQLKTQEDNNVQKVITICSKNYTKRMFW